MLRLPPPYTLFPYTTLFRSRVAEQLLRPAEREPEPGHHLVVDEDRAVVLGQAAEFAAELGGQRHEPQDRKSTRLNSSHQIISYAVFCLKKKKSHTPSNAHRS